MAVILGIGVWTVARVLTGDPAVTIAVHSALIAVFVVAWSIGLDRGSRVQKVVTAIGLVAVWVVSELAAGAWLAPLPTRTSTPVAAVFALVVVALAVAFSTFSRDAS